MCRKGYRGSLLKKLNCLLVIPLLLLVATALACQPGGGQGLEIRPAPIHEVRVAIAESYPPQVMVSTFRAVFPMAARHFTS